MLRQWLLVLALASADAFHACATSSIRASPTMPRCAVTAVIEFNSNPSPMALIKGLLPTTLPDRPKAGDAALAGLGLFSTIALLGFLEDVTGLKLFAPAMMASGIIFFVGPAPPDPRGFLSGTLCSATLSALLLYTLDEILPPIAADGASAALLLIWYKTVGSIFPPAAVLAGTLTAAAANNAAALTPNDALVAGATFVVFPWLTGHGALYLGALATSHVRRYARVALVEDQMHELGGMSDEKLLEVFRKVNVPREPPKWPFQGAAGGHSLQSPRVSAIRTLTSAHTSQLHGTLT